MKNNHITEQSRWCKEFLSSEGVHSKVERLASELNVSGLKYVHACLMYYNSGCTLKDVAKLHGDVTASCAGQYIRAGYKILRREFSNEPEHVFYQQLKRLFRYNGFKDYPTFMRIYRSLMRAEVNTIQKVLDLTPVELLRIRGIGGKSVDYLMSMQYAVPYALSQYT